MVENNESLPKKSSSALAGNEKSLNYKIQSIPQDRGRFGFTWDVLKGRFGSFVTINLIMLLFFTPLITLFMMRLGQITTLGALGAFGDNLGVGYPASPDTVGMAELLIMEVDTIFFALAIALSVITAAGVAGGVYCVRKLLRSDEELRIIKDFIQGIKSGYLSSLIACLLSFTMIFVFVRVWDYAAYQTALGGNAALYIVFGVLVSIALAIVLLFSVWVLSIGSNYKQSVFGLIKNSLSLGFGTVIQSVFFAAFSVSPLLLSLIGFLSFLVPIYFLLLGFSLALLIWCSFTDWAFDSFADYTSLQSDAQEVEAKKTAPKSESEGDILSLLLVDGKNSYLSRAMQSVDEGACVYTLPTDFNEKDLQRLAESKRTLLKESESYAAAHADEEKYKAYNARFDDREKVLTDKDKKGKKVQFAPKMLNQ